MTMNPLSDIPPEELRDAWRHLAAHGTPPAAETAPRVLPAWSVGIDGWLDRLVHAHLRDFCRRNSHFKLVVAPYGGGKTHFLLAMSARAAAENWAVCYLQCKDAVNVGDWFGLYEQVVRSVRLPGSDRVGIHAIVEAALEQMRQRSQQAPDPEVALEAMIDAVRRDNWPHGSFGRVMATALAHLDDRHADDGEGGAALDWLEGNLAKETLQVLRRLRLPSVRASDRGRHGRELFYSLVRFIPMTGAHGLVLLLDEMETSFNARGKALERILVAMRTMLDAPDHRTARVPLFGLFAAVPDVWSEIIAKRYEALRQRFQVFDPFHQGNDDAPQIDLSQLGRQVDFLRSMGERLLELGIRANGWTLDRSRQQANLEKLARVTDEQLLEVSARRLFVKAWCSLLSEQARNGERDYPEDSLRDRVRGVYDEIREGEAAANEQDIG